MKGWIDGGMGRWVDGRKTDGRMAGWKGEWKDGWMGEDGVKMGGWKDRWKEGGKERKKEGGWKNEWMRGRVDGPQGLADVDPG